MFKKFTLAAVAAAAAVTTIPAAAEARPRGYYDQGYNRGYDNGYYEQRRYNRGYNNRGYYGRHAYRGRCSGTTGTILGGVLGALAGRSIDKSDCRR